MCSRLRNAHDERDQGFTLIELLVVVIIIGILAAIAIPVFLNQRKKGIDASLKADLKSMAIAQDTYIVDNPSAAGRTIAMTTPGGQATVASVNDFTASPGNVLEVGRNNGGYCIRAFNAGATSHVTYATAMYYDSLAGGLNTSGGSC